MAIHGSTWQYMVIHSNTWLYMAVHGNTWQYMVIHSISMCNQMVTSEIREKFHARFVQILIISQAREIIRIWTKRPNGLLTQRP